MPSEFNLTFRGTRLALGGATRIMGIINATPDSFSGDGTTGSVEAAVRLAESFVEAGADLIDIGGESTRPGHAQVSAEVEAARVLPVIEAVARRVRVPVSVDTSKAEVARRALQAGASMVNDVWGLTGDPAMCAVVAEAGCPVVLMHNQQGTVYRDLVGDVAEWFRRQLERAAAAGIDPEQCVIDPGIGFGKTPEQNLRILRDIASFHRLGRPVLVGPSRKSVIGRVLNLPVEERVEGTAAVVAWCIAQGVQVVRVHDVAAMVRVARMIDAVRAGALPQSTAPEGRDDG